MALRLASRQARLVVFGYNAATEKICWERNPELPQYAGSPLSLRGGKVMAYYKDGTVADVTDVCGYDPAAGSRLEYGGELIITAAYTDHAGNQFAADTRIEISDVDRLLFSSIANPVQKEGARLDLTGAVLTARYTDGTTRPVSPSSVTFEPAAGAFIPHASQMAIQAVWKDPATGSEYSAEYKLTIDPIEKIFFSHLPTKYCYAEGEPLNLAGTEISVKYRRSGDTAVVTDKLTFFPANGDIMSASATVLTAYYEAPSGEQYECKEYLNIERMMIPVSVIGQIIGEDLGLQFNDNLPSDFWDDFGSAEVQYILTDSNSYLPTDTYGSIVDYLCSKGAFTSYERYGNIPYMKLPAGTYQSADGKNAISARADIYIIAAMMKKNGRPEKLPNPSCVDYPYTNVYAYNQIHVLTFTLNAADYTQCKSGLKGGYNSATEGICRKMAGLGLYDVEDERMYTEYVTFEDPNIVNIPGILALPWCWYDDVPHDLNVLKTIVQNGTHSSGCVGITHNGRVPYLTYSKESVYAEVAEQFPELFTENVTYGETEYVHVEA